MRHWTMLAAALLLPTAVYAEAPKGLTGQYIEARTCDVWTGPCFANAETSMAGKHAVLAWKVDSGSFDGVQLDGLAVAAVVAAKDTLGTEQTGTGKAVLIVDRRANAKQKEALVKLVKQQAGDLVKTVLKVEAADIDLTRCECHGGSCAVLKAGAARIETKCLNENHKVCGNECAYYPPLVGNVKAQAALAAESSFSGTAFGETWKERNRRSAYVGTFTVSAE